MDLQALDALMTKISKFAENVNDETEHRYSSIDEEDIQTTENMNDETEHGYSSIDEDHR